MNDIVIFGSTGFIGNNIYNFLIGEGYNVKGFSSEACNLLDQSEIKKVFTLIKNDFNLIICSAITSSVDDSIESMFTNIQMIDNVAKEVSIEQVKIIIFFSSVDIYGSIKYTSRIDENTPQRSVGYYGLSKIVSERLLCHNIQKIPVTVLRLPGIYGYGDNSRSIVGKFIKDGITKKEITITNDGNQLRDYVEIRDLCEIVSYFIAKPFNGPVNIVSGESIKIRKIADIVINKLDDNVAIKKVKTDSNSSDFIFNNSLIRSIMPSFTFTDIKEGIDRYIKAL